MVPERISSVTNGVRFWSLAGVKAIRIGKLCELGVEGGETVRGRGDWTTAFTGARLGVVASVRLAAEVVTAAAGAEVRVTRKA